MGKQCKRRPGYWSHALKVMSAIVGGFDGDLNVSNRIPVKSFLYDLTLQFDKQDIDGKMSVLTDDDGNIVDSWLGFNRLSITGLTGIFRCTEERCKLDGATTSNLLMENSPSGNLLLTGKRNQLSGELGLKGQTIFPLTAIQPQLFSEDRMNINRFTLLYIAIGGIFLSGCAAPGGKYGSASQPDSCAIFSKKMVFGGAAGAGTGALAGALIGGTKKKAP